MQIPLGFLQMFSAQSWSRFWNMDAENSRFGAAFLTAFLMQVAYNFLAQLMSVVSGAALTRAVADHLFGKTVSIISSYRQVLSKLVHLFLSNALLFILATLLYFWILVPCLGWFSGPGLLFAVTILITPMLTPVLVFEKLYFDQAILRSWVLVRQRFWWVGLLMFFSGLLYIFIINGPVSTIQLILLGVTNSDGFPAAMKSFVEVVVQTIVNVLGILIFTPLQLTLVTLLYFDLRVRAEGLDLALRTAVLQDEQIDETVIASTATIPPWSRIFTWSDIANLAVITILGVTIYFLIFGLFVSLIYFLAALAGP